MKRGVVHLCILGAVWAIGAAGCAQPQQLEPGDDTMADVPDDPGASGGVAPVETGGVPGGNPNCIAPAKVCGGVCTQPAPAVGCTPYDCNPCPEAPPGYVSVCVNGACGTAPASDDPAADPTSTSTTEPPPAPTSTDDPSSLPPMNDPNYDACIALTTEDTCTRCVCTQCQTQSLDCGATGDATRDQACTAIVECGRANHCTSVGCYCGAADLNACVDAPLGACVSEIQAAVGSTVFDDVANALAAQGTAVYLADQVGQCAALQCAVECGL